MRRHATGLLVVVSAFAAGQSDTKPSSEANTCFCGEANDDGLGKTANKPLNVREAKRHQFPWMARVYYGGTAICAGTVISGRAVITSATCTRGGPDPSNYKILLAAHEAPARLDGGALPQHSQLYSIDKVVLHPNNSLFSNNLALLIIRDTVKFSSRLRPICLPKNKGEGPDQRIIMSWNPTTFPLETVNRIYNNALYELNEMEALSSMELMESLDRLQSLQRPERPERLYIADPDHPPSDTVTIRKLARLTKHTIPLLDENIRRDQEEQKRHQSSGATTIFKKIHHTLLKGDSSKKQTLLKLMFGHNTNPLARIRPSPVLTSGLVRMRPYNICHDVLQTFYQQLFDGENWPVGANATLQNITSNLICTVPYAAENALSAVDCDVEGGQPLVFRPASGNSHVLAAVLSFVPDGREYFWPPKCICNCGINTVPAFYSLFPKGLAWVEETLRLEKADIFCKRRFFSPSENASASSSMVILNKTSSIPASGNPTSESSSSINVPASNLTDMAITAFPPTNASTSVTTNRTTLPNPLPSTSPKTKRHLHKNAGYSL